MDKYELGRRIAQCRIKQNLSVTQLANITDIPRHTIYHIEMGRHSPTIHRMIAIANALKIAPGSLLCTSDEDGLKETVWEKFAKVSVLHIKRLDRFCVFGYFCNKGM